MNGKPGDHPLTDIVTHGLTVFGPEADDLIKKLSRLMSGPELDALVNWLDPPPVPELTELLESALQAKRQEAKERGWEIEE